MYQNAEKPNDNSIEYLYLFFIESNKLSLIVDTDLTGFEDHRADLLTKFVIIGASGIFFTGLIFLVFMDESEISYIFYNYNHDNSRLKFGFNIIHIMCTSHKSIQ